MKETQWHLSKGLSVSLILGVLCNISALVWAASAANSDLEDYERRITSAEKVNQELLGCVQVIAVDVAVIKERVKNL